MRQSNGRWPRRRGPAPASARDAGACLGSETDREANSEQRAERQLQPTHLPQRTDRRAAVRARPPSGVALPASLRGYELGRCWPLRGPHAGRRGAGTGRRLAGFAGCNTAVNLPGGSAVTWSHNRGVSRHAGNASRVPAGSTPNLNTLSGKQSWVEHRTILPGRSYPSNNPDRNRPERRIWSQAPRPTLPAGPVVPFQEPLIRPRHRRSAARYLAPARARAARIGCGRARSRDSRPGTAGQAASWAASLRGHIHLPTHSLMPRAASARGRGRRRRRAAACASLADEP